MDSQAVTVVREAPSRDSLVGLAEYQEKTPSSYASGPPVLHFQSLATIVITRDALEENNKLFEDVKDLVLSSDDMNEEKVIEGAEVWVASNKLNIFFKNSNAGLSIPYQCIALHAKRQRPSAPFANAIYLQLNLYNPQTVNSDEEMSIAMLDIIPSDVSYPHGQFPPTASTSTSPDTSPEVTGSSSSRPNETNKPAPPPCELLYDALTACADLNPDQDSQASDEAMDEADDSTMPGAGGWITIDNMADYMDEDGNLIGAGGGGGPSLGPGAGSVHHREEGHDLVAKDETDGHEKNEDATKRHKAM